MPQPVVVALYTAVVNPLTVKGSLARVSPDEPVHAWLLAVCRDIQDGAGDGVLQGWYHSALTTSFHFELLPSDDEQLYRAANLREAGRCPLPTLMLGGAWESLVLSWCGACEL